MSEEAVQFAFVLLNVTARTVGMIVALSWLVGVSGAGPRARVAVAVLIALAATPLLSAEIGPPPGLGAMGFRLIGEGLMGAGLGLTAGLIAGAARLAGSILAIGAGLSGPASLAPGADGAGHESPLTTLGVWLALATFALLDGPMVLVRTLIESYRLQPTITDLAALERIAGESARLVGATLGLALRLAAPAALAMLAAQVAVGLGARAAPSISQFVVWLPARVALGLLLLTLSIPFVIRALILSWSRLSVQGGALGL